MSIWDLIDRKSFETDAAELRGICEHHQPQPPAHGLNHKVEHEDTTCILPYETERRLAGDFAYITAWQSIAGYVSAASIVELSSTPGLLISVAANEGVNEPVREALKNILEILQQCANGRGKDACTRECLIILVGLHKERILERFYRPYDRVHSSMAARLLKIRDEIAVRKKGNDPRVKDLLMNQLESAARLMKDAETAADECKTAAIIDLIHVAWQLTTEEFVLGPRLGKFGYPPKVAQRREVRVINVLSNYWRICQYLTSAARSYHDLFRHISLNVINNYPYELRDGVKHWVHAEIQLLIFHEMRDDILKPRAIMASKRACFLCASFMLAHQRYSVDRSHGKVILSWTLPDRADYTENGKELLQRTLALTAESVSTVLHAARDRPKKRTPIAYPPQSVLSLVCDQLPAPSIRTVSDWENDGASITSSCGSNPAEDSMRHLRWKGLLQKVKMWWKDWLISR